MTERYLAQIFMMASTFAPKDSANCDGQLVSISSQSALFSLIGSLYGGDGRTTFKYPDLRSRVPIGNGHAPGLSARPLAQSIGTETVSLTVNEIPLHNHSLALSKSVPKSRNPKGNLPALANIYATGYQLDPNRLGTFSEDAVSRTGESEAHENRMPSLVVRFLMVIQGIYPSR